MSFDSDYAKSLERVLVDGSESTNERTGVGTRKVFDQSFTMEVGNGCSSSFRVPRLRLRRVSDRIAFEELMWILRGSTDVRELQEKKIHIWDGNSSRAYLDNIGLYDTPEHTIGKAYGYQMRNFNGVDQLQTVFESLRDHPETRRHLISFWNCGDFDEMALHPCHYAYNFVVTKSFNNEYVLNLKQNIRSGDSILGTPTNVMFASFFLAIMANALGYISGTLATNIDDYHIYSNHLKHARKLIRKTTVDFAVDQPAPRYQIRKELNSLDDILSLQWEDIEQFGGYGYAFNWSRKDLPMAV